LINRAVVNSSPLIVLFKSQQAELLPQMFSEILVPGAVWAEITAPGAEDAAAVQLPSVSWARQVQVSVIAPEVASWDLGLGESAVLSQVLLTPANSAAIVDDRAARRCAQSLGLVTIGTGGLLIRAKRRGLISSVSQRIQALREAGLWLSDDLVNLLKIQAGE